MEDGDDKIVLELGQAMGLVVPLETGPLLKGTAVPGRDSGDIEVDVGEGAG